MKTLLILRHAKSSWKNNELSDHDRPLNPRGQRDAPNVGKRLRNEDLVPDAILSSTALLIKYPSSSNCAIIKKLFIFVISIGRNNHHVLSKCRKGVREV